LPGSLAGDHRAGTARSQLGHPRYENLRSYPRLSRLHLAPEQLVNLVRHLPLKFAPGSRWRYSNSGYAILGLIIERATGHPLADYLQTHIFSPLGLRATSYDVNHPPVPTHAIGYAGPGRPAPYIDISTVYAAGAIASTVGDLNRWDQALMTGHPGLLPRASLSAMFVPRIPVAGVTQRKLEHHVADHHTSTGPQHTPGLAQRLALSASLTWCRQ
jgi:CubicO group peptidase (beta-lactamase class C family)